MKKEYIFAARSSLLSVTQTNEILEELRAKFSHQANFKLQVLETKGDQILNAPLWKIEGKDFFTQELDQLLANRKVDACVHSSKDLSTTRPQEFKLAAFTKRHFPYDILFMKKSDIQSKRSFPMGEKCIIGTSSPRRIYQIETHLPALLPKFMNVQQIECKTLRGNVPSRIKKLLDSNNGMHGIVLAYAGVERLAKTNEIDDLLKNLECMVLPLSQFTPSPGQGALAVEVHQDCDPELLEMLKSIDDPTTRTEVEEEKRIFAQFGGGCHLPMGIFIHNRPNYKVIYQQGTLKQQNEIIPSPKIPIEYFNGVKDDELIQKKSNLNRNEVLRTHQGAILATSRYVFDYLEYNRERENLLENFVVCAGVQSWKIAAKRNFWIRFCLDSLGEQDSQMKHFLGSSLFQKLYGNIRGDNYISLNAQSGAYDRIVQTDLSPEFVKKIEECQHFYWGSFFQYCTYVKRFPHLLDPINKHYCGLGKTYDQFIEHNIAVSPILMRNLLGI